MDDKKGEIIDWLLPLSLTFFIILFFVLEHQNLKEFQRNTERLREEMSISVSDSPERADTREQYRFIDTDASDPEMQKELYKRFYYVNRDTYFAYQVKRVGESVTYFSYQVSPSGENCSACQSIKVISSEKSRDYPGLETQDGFSFIAVTLEVVNTGETDIKWFPVMTKVGILDDKSTFVKNEYGTTFSSVLQEYGEKRGASSEGEGEYREADKDKDRFPDYIYISPQESFAYRLIYRIPEEFMDDSMLAVGDDTSAINGNYCNCGYRFYINQ